MGDEERRRLLDRAAPHGPDDACTCPGCWACPGYVTGCTCDIDWDTLAELRQDDRW